MWNCFWPNFNMGFNPFMTSMMPFGFNFFGCQPMNPFCNFAPSIFNFTPQYSTPKYNDVFGLFSQPSFNFSFDKTSNEASKSSVNKSKGRLGAKMLEHAKKYIGKVNSDAEGNRLFSPGGKAQGWCYDFIRSMFIETNADVAKIFKTTSYPPDAKNEAIKQGAYVKNPKASDLHPGDILVTEGKGPSGLHVGLVDRVENGKIYIVAGNSSKNSVSESSYALNSSKVYGVIQTDKLA